MADTPAREVLASEPRRARRLLRIYSMEQRAEAVALAASVGSTKASEVLGIPQRTISDWTRMPAASEVIAQAERTIADRLREAHSVALDAVLEGVQDPAARLADKARALEVLGQQLALAEGRATSHNLNVNATVLPTMDEDERIRLRRVLEAAVAAQSETEGGNPDPLDDDD